MPSIILTDHKIRAMAEGEELWDSLVPGALLIRRKKKSLAMARQSPRRRQAAPAVVGLLPGTDDQGGAPGRPRSQGEVPGRRRGRAGHAAPVVA